MRMKSCLVDVQREERRTKITTTLHIAQDQSCNKEYMPNPCTQRKGSERILLINVLMKRNCGCGCEIHGAGCFAAVAQSLGFDATRIIIQQRLLRYSTASDYVKKSQSGLEEALRRLI
jgi:hypothetical protein